eukprot:4672159-Prymnesium_polylepis.2
MERSVMVLARLRSALDSRRFVIVPAHVRCGLSTRVCADAMPDGCVGRTSAWVKTPVNGSSCDPVRTGFTASNSATEWKFFEGLFDYRRPVHEGGTGPESA